MYPETAGFKEHTTSRAAAHTIKADVLRERVLEHVCKGPTTADECAEALGETVLAIRPRFSELRALGMVNDSGVRRKNISGRPAIVWSVV